MLVGPLTGAILPVTSSHEGSCLKSPQGCKAGAPCGVEEIGAVVGAYLAGTGVENN